MRKKYRELFAPRSRRKPGPKGPPAEIIEAILELKRRNPTVGCTRIALIINRLVGVEPWVDAAIEKRAKEKARAKGDTAMATAFHKAEGRAA